MHLYVGGRIHIMPHFAPEGYLDLVEGEGVTSSLVVPTMLTMILDRLRQENRPRDLSALERLVTCGSPLQEAPRRRFWNRSRRICTTITARPSPTA